MSLLKKYRGSRPLAVPRDTVESALELLKSHELRSALKDELAKSKADFRVLQNGSFETTKPTRLPRNFQADTDVSLDAATINAIKQVMFTAGLHEIDAFAADIVGLAPGRCPPPTYKCPKAR